MVTNRVCIYTIFVVTFIIFLVILKRKFSILIHFVYLISQIIEKSIYVWMMILFITYFTQLSFVRSIDHDFLQLLTSFYHCIVYLTCTNK